MIPGTILGCAQLPLTGNGKVDRQALSAWLAENNTRVPANLSPPAARSKRRWRVPGSSCWAVVKSAVKIIFRPGR